MTLFTLDISTIELLDDSLRHVRSFVVSNHKTAKT